MLLVCALSFVIDAGGINMETKADVEGKVVTCEENKCIVDFREGLKKYKKAVNPENYDKVLVNRYDCVKEN